MKRKFLILVSLLLAVLMLVSCGQNKTTEVKEESKTVKEEVAQVEEKEEKKEEVEEIETFYTEATLPDYEAKANEVIVNEDSVTFIDGLGEEKTIKKNPERVVGLYPSHVMLWYENGGEVVGRITTKSSEERMSTVAPDVEIVGDGTSPDKLSLEKIMALEPDLVFMGVGSQTTMVETFKDLGIESIVIDNETLTDYLKWVKVIANINNKPEIYEDVIQTVLNPIQEILLKVPAENNPKMLMMQGNEKGNLVAYLPGTTAGGMADDLRADNIAVGLTDVTFDASKGIDKTDLSWESLLENQPDLILIKHSNMDKEFSMTKMVKDTLAENPVWASLDAVKADEIYSLPTEYFYHKPTRDYPDGYEYLAKILYPEIFGEQIKDYATE